MLKERPVCVCLLLQYAVRVGKRGIGRTCAARDNEPRPVWTSRPSRTSECGGEGACVKEAEGEEGEHERERALGLRCCYYATALDIEVDPQCRCFGRRESDFALQRLVECCALETERVRLVVLRWYSSGSQVRLGLQVGLS
jgi:hypothetical protein